MIAVPAVLGHRSFILSITQRFAAQSIVFNIVNRFQKKYPLDGCKNKQQHAGPAENENNEGEEDDLNDLKNDHLIVNGKNLVSIFPRVSYCNSAGTDVAHKNAAEIKCIDHLAQSCTTRVFWCSHSFMMALIVFNIKMHIKRRKQI